MKAAMTIQQAIDAKEEEIRKGMHKRCEELCNSEPCNFVAWVIPRALGCAQRPLRCHPSYKGSRVTLPVEAAPLVHDWANQIREEGIQSVISLMHDRDLRCYEQLELPGGDLNSFLKWAGFVVEWLPWEDPAHLRSNAEEMRRKRKRMQEAGLVSYDKLQKPVLVMCSAGEDRSAPVAAYIWQHRFPVHSKEAI